MVQEDTSEITRQRKRLMSSLMLFCPPSLQLHRTAASSTVVSFSLKCSCCHNSCFSFVVQPLGFIFFFRARRLSNTLTALRCDVNVIDAVFAFIDRHFCSLLLSSEASNRAFSSSVKNASSAGCVIQYFRPGMEGCQTAGADMFPYSFGMAFAVLSRFFHVICLHGLPRYFINRVGRVFL